MLECNAAEGACDSASQRVIVTGIGQVCKQGFLERVRPFKGVMQGGVHRHDRIGCLAALVATVDAEGAWPLEDSGAPLLRTAGLLRCASSRRPAAIVSPLTGGHPSRNAVRPALPAGITTAARSRARGSRAFTPSRVRERGPLDELAVVPFTPLRFADLGLVEYRGNKDNNLILTDPAPLGFVNLKVLLDPSDPDPERRYKISTHVYFHHNTRLGTLAPFASADGLRWKLLTDAKPRKAELKEEASYQTAAEFQALASMCATTTCVLEKKNRTRIFYNTTGTNIFHISQ